MAVIFTSIAEIETFFAKISYKKTDSPPFTMMRIALEKLGNPEKIGNFIHITGTNGKGSTINYIATMLNFSGISVGKFTSPHIFNINERISIDGNSISDADFIATFQYIYDNIAHCCMLIQFEWLTLMAFVYFAKSSIDYTIIEVGIGGLYDTTNCIDHKKIAAITTISLDHQGILGDSLSAIFEQKAGIITAKTDIAFIGKLPKELLTTNIAIYPNILYRYGRDFSITGDNLTIGSMVFKLSPNNVPAFQKNNYLLALAIVKYILEDEKGEEYLHSDLQKMVLASFKHTLPIRFERVCFNDTVLIFDGAHNCMGIQTILETLTACYPDKKYHFIYSAMADKDFTSILALLQEYGAVSLYDYYPIYQRAQQIPLANTLVVFNSPPAVFTEISNNTNKDMLYIFIGSMYFVSYIRSAYTDFIKTC